MENYLYLNVHFRDKELAKSIGCKWDDKVRQWYAPNAHIKSMWESTVNNKELAKFYSKGKK